MTQAWIAADEHAAGLYLCNTRQSHRQQQIKIRINRTRTGKLCNYWV